MQVLRFLAEHHDRVVTKDELLEAVWPDTFTTDGVLKRAISQARRALGDGVDGANFIETYHGQGYRFIAPVTRTTPEAASQTPVETKPEPPPTHKTETAAMRAADTFKPFRAVMFDAKNPNYNPFVGREAEFGLLQTEFRRTLEGTGHPVILIGDAGIGKTQLARQFKRWTRVQSAMCLYARFYDYQANRVAPFAGLLEMLRKALCGNQDASNCDLRTVAQTKLNVTLPEGLFLEMPLPSAGQTGQVNAHRTTGMLSSTVARAVIPLSQCFLRLSQRAPLVLIFDDLQWADDACLGVIGYLMRTLQHEPLLIVGLARTDAAADREHRLRLWLKEQASYRSYTALTIKPLDEAACQKAIEAVFHQRIQPPAADVQTLHRLTDGNPYFLMEMLRLLAAEQAISYSEDTWHWQGIQDIRLPETIVMAAQAKLDRLSDEMREMLDCAAVLGEEFRIDELAKVAGKSEDEIEALLPDGIKPGVLSDRGLSAGYDARFHHTILRRVLYDQILPRRRKRLHLLAAQALEALHPDNRDRVAEAIHAHYEAASDSASRE
ncbi:MAG: AAA family ATPase [Blastocatellia bacterium]